MHLFRHLCLYAVRMEEVKKKKGASEERQVLDAVGEMRPDATIGGIQALLWLDNEMIAAVTSNGYLRLMQYSVQDGMLLEDQHKPTGSGVAAACLCKQTGQIAIVTPKCVTFFDPLLLGQLKPEREAIARSDSGAD